MALHSYLRLSIYCCSKVCLRSVYNGNGKLDVNFLKVFLLCKLGYICFYLNGHWVQVSGEYSMIKAGGVLKMIDEEKVMMDFWVCLRHAGADIILTYFALQAARALCGEKKRGRGGLV